jgi:chromate transporter
MTAVHNPSERLDPATGRGPARIWQVFAVALGLGLTSFGGPIAHLGYFERAYVQRRRWLSAHDYAAIVALCQVVPGPTSSQIGFLIGLRRAGWAGAFAAWLGFTLPSALIMVVFARLSSHFTGPLLTSVLEGLKLVAVAVVAQAVWSMGRKLCPDLTRTALALVAAAILLFYNSPVVQVVALMVGALGGVGLCRYVPSLDAASPPPVGRRLGLLAGVAFLALLILLPLCAQTAPRSLLGVGSIFYRAGALVFGGGHVVLPLLRDALIPGWISDNAFLAGYGAAQAVPGPLFTFAAYLGALVAPAGSGVGQTALWSAAALGFIFLPGLLVATAGISLWTWVGHHPTARGALAGVNAAVVGVLGAALYTPIWTSAVRGPQDVAIALVAFLLLERWRAPPPIIVLFCIAATLTMAHIRSA